MREILFLGGLVCLYLLGYLLGYELKQTSKTICESKRQTMKNICDAQQGEVCKVAQMVYLNCAKEEK